MKTVMAKKGAAKKETYLVDAEDRILGRLASHIAPILMGKHKSSYTPNVDTGDNVIVIKADKVRVSGNKRTGKLYKRYSGYPSGLKTVTMSTLLERKPKEAVRTAVRKMLPKTRLGKKMLKKLKIYTGSEKALIPDGAKEFKF